MVRRSTMNIPQPNPREQVNYQRLSTDMTSSMMVERAVQGVSFDFPSTGGPVDMAVELELFWQEMGDTLSEWFGLTKEDQALLQSAKMSVKKYRGMVAMMRDDARKAAIRDLRAEHFANMRQRGPRTRHNVGTDLLFQKGNTTALTVYDGQPLFDGSHIGPGATTFSNLQTGVYALNEINLDLVLDIMLAYENRKGVNFGNSFALGLQTVPEGNRNFIVNTSQFHLFVGRKQRSAAEALLNPRKESPSKFAGQGTFSLVDSISNGPFPDSWFVWMSHRPEDERKPLMYATWTENQTDFVENVHDDKFEAYVAEVFGFNGWHWSGMFMSENQ
jgi:hypothetical protein